MDTEAHLPEFYPPIPDDPGMTPAFAKISPIQRAWVMAYLEAGDENASAAARRAGYGQGKGDHAHACKQAGYRNVHDPDVQEAMRELAQERFRIAGYKAVQRLMQIVEDPTHKDHFKAIERVLAQNGMIAALQVEHNHKVTVTESEQVKQVVALARRLGLDPKTLLGSAGVEYVDAEFEDVTSADHAEQMVPALTAPEEPAMSSAGLEDLL